jgi:hypothetical protein
MSRFWNRLKALWGGFFWMPCPICGKNFGGHEWRVTWMQSAFRGVGVCRNCEGEATARNVANAEIFAEQERQWWMVMKFEMSKTSDFSSERK